MVITGYIKCKFLQEFLDAPFTATGKAQAAVTDNFEPPFYQWWDAQETETEEGTLRVYEGWKDSVDAVKSKISSSGPYDGVLGFSQVCMQDYTAL